MKKSVSSIRTPWVGIVMLFAFGCGSLLEGVAADKPSENGTMNSLTALTFSHPSDITNPYLPLTLLKQDILEGKEGGKKVRIERTARRDVHKTFKIGPQMVEALAVEDREFENGKLSEVAMDYFAQADDGTVLYLGEDVDEYRNGKLVGHEGAWLFGKDTQTPGVIMPGHPKVGEKFKSEDVNKEIHEEDEVISISETVTVPAGTYRNCLKIKEVLAEGETEYKYFAPEVGCVREVPSDGDVLLKSHQTKSGKTNGSGTAKMRNNRRLGWRSLGGRAFLGTVTAPALRIRE